jgi:hypothetical protein
MIGAITAGMIGIVAPVPKATGGTITSDANYFYHTFTASVTNFTSPTGNPICGAAVQSATTNTNTTGISVTNASAGVSGTNANLPPYYALCYIMKT